MCGTYPEGDLPVERENTCFKLALILSGAEEPLICLRAPKIHICSLRGHKV